MLNGFCNRTTTKTTPFENSTKMEVETKMKIGGMTPNEKTQAADKRIA